MILTQILEYLIISLKILLKTVIMTTHVCVDLKVECTHENARNRQAIKMAKHVQKGIKHAFTQDEGCTHLMWHNINDLAEDQCLWAGIYAKWLIKGGEGQVCWHTDDHVTEGTAAKTQDLKTFLPITCAWHVQNCYSVK